MIKKIIGSFFLCCLNLGILWGQSNPIPFSLSQANYSLIQWPSASTAGTYPSAMKFHSCTTVNAGLTTPTSGDYVGVYNGNSGARVNGLSSNGFYIAGVYNTTPTMGAAVLGLNSVGRGNINVSFQTSTILTGNPANVRLQYRIASNNNIWIDVPGPIEYVSNGSTSLNLTLYNLNLSTLTSGDINDRPDFQLRWKYYRTSGSATNDCAIAIDEITVSSSPLPSPSIATGLAPAQQYCVTPTVGTPLVLNFSYNPSSSFTIGSNFIVELSNASGSFAVPIACGTALSDGTGSQNMNVTIPANTATGSGYRLRVKNSDNGVVGNDNGANIQVDLVPVVVTSVVPNARYRQVLLNWINPAFCWDEVMVVAREASLPSSSPTGNGSQYTANAQFALGSALGGGYVVYKGTGTSINITGLTPEISYGIIVWTRFGADWIAISPFSVMTPSIPVLSATPVIISQGEYFWNLDPGAGNGVAFSAEDGAYDRAFERIVKSGLTAPNKGQNILNVRVKDGAGLWSNVFSTVINVDSSDTHLGFSLTKVTQAEYWWDTDPGVGNASPVLALDGNLNAAFEGLVKNGLQAPHFGRSTFNIRVKDNSNNWSGKFTTIINVDSSDTHLGYSLTKLTQAEYWWDTDPGVGNASPVLALDGNLNAAFEELVKNGLQAPHFGRSTFNIRVKDNSNNWSGKFTTIINVDSTTFVGPLFTAQRIKQQEFYWDVDPGENNGTAMLPDDGYANSGFERFKVAGNYTQNLPNGVHILGMRTKDANGVWSAPFKTTVDVNFLGNTFAVYTNPAFAIRCQGQSVTLNALGGVSYSWSPSNGLNTTIGSTVIATPLETTTYSVVGVNSFGLTDTAYVTIQVNSPASIIGDAILDLCPGAYLELSSSSSFGNYWSTGATTQTISVTQGGTYTLVSENGCGINTSSVIVNMLSVTPPVIVADGPTQFCVGSGIGLSAGSGIEYLWSNGSTDPSIFVQETGSYSVTVTPDGGCPSTSQPISITASAVPNASITASGSTTICAGSFVTLTAPTGVNLTYQWLKNGLEISGASTNQFNVTASGFYNCIVSYLGCSSMSNMITVSTIQLPTAVITPVSSTTICMGGNVVLQGPSGSGFTYQWKLNNTSISGATSSSYTASVAGNYTLIIASNGCFSGSSAITVSVISLPTANITVTGSLTFCQNGSVTLTASSGTGNTYQWFKNSIAIVGATNQVYTANGTGIYYVVVTRSSCSATSTTKTVVVNPLPVANITPAGPTSFCSGGSVVLNATTGTGYSFQWKLNGINITGASGTSYTAIQAGNYALTVSAGGCFATSSLIPVQVGEPITAVITAQGNTSFCSGNSVNLSANTGAGLTYQWKNDGSNIIGATSSTYSATQTGNYTCVVGNNGCPTNSNTIAVNASSSFSVDITAQGSTNICLGGSVMLSTTPVNGYVYFWKFNGDTIPGAHQFEYAALLSGQYTLDVSYNNCIVGSNVITVVTGSPPSQPILTCYQTATFNTATCSWDVTGTQAAAPTGLSCWQSAAFNTATCSWVITGTQAAAPSLTCWQTAVFNTATCAWDVSGTQDAAPTGLSCWQAAAFNTISCTWDVSGTQPAQPTLSCWQTATFNTTTCVWDVSGTQDAEPTGLSCWQAAAFNTISCTWDVSGTQPAQPTLSCWQTATFNTTTCVWDVSGTQDAEPTGLSCWQTATFNTTSCAWDVSGTQPVQPTLACWQTAAFNTTTCAWVIIGIQPAAPTGLACYEIAAFNTTSCSWVVSGTQPVLPIIACYEIATFNTTNCAWVVTGTQATEPTGLACYETATFNTTTCAWVVSGTQATEPTVACYETAVFSTTLCSWVVSGSPITNTTSISVAGSYTWSNNGQTYTSSGLYTGTTVNCETQVLNLTITPNSATLSLQVFLDGYYINSLNPAAMTAARYNNLVASGSANPGANTDVDVITVELRSPSNLDVVAYSVSPILQTNGSVQCVFPAGALGGSFYIVVKHRAAIPLWSAVPILISNGTAINFSNNVLNSFSDGDPLSPSVHELNPGLYGLWMGELYYDSYLDGNDYPLFEVDVNSSSYADLYLLNGDLNGNTYVDASDYSVFNYNSQQGVYEQRPYAISTNVSIGQSYQGGIVAYILQPGDPGYDATMQHGLIAAPSDLGYAPWGCHGTVISGADGTAIGTGNQNTIDIMTGCNEAGIAARLCGDLVLGGYSDWYLPSKDELNKLYLNRVAIGGFAWSYYWSSTEIDNNLAWGQHFVFGFQYNYVKYLNYTNDGFYVRAVRAF